MKNIKILLYIIVFSLIFFYFGNHSFKFEEKNIKLKRILLEKEDFEKICSKTSEKFDYKYKNMDYKKKKEVNYNENDKELINYLKNQNIKKIYKYVKYILFRYMIFILIDIILIFFWIYFWFCSCNPCWCCHGEKAFAVDCLIIYLYLCILQ